MRILTLSAHTQITRIGAPQPHDIVTSLVSQARHSLDRVSGTVVPLYMDAAHSLVEEQGPVHALARALACIAGTTAVNPRSLFEYVLSEQPLACTCLYSFSPLLLATPQREPQ